jgi:hypothetical protein
MLDILLNKYVVFFIGEMLMFLIPFFYEHAIVHLVVLCLICRVMHEDRNM